MLQCPRWQITWARVSSNGLAGKLHEVFARRRSHLFDAHDQFLLNKTRRKGFSSGA